MKPTNVEETPEFKNEEIDLRATQPMPPSFKNLDSFVTITKQPLNNDFQIIDDVIQKTKKIKKLLIEDMDQEDDTFDWGQSR